MQHSAAAGIARPFLDLEKTRVATTLEFFSDASLNEVFGFGVRFEENWLFGKWPTNFIRDKKPSIEYVELFGLTIAVFAWGDKLRNLRAEIFCDNLSVVNMINHTTSGSKSCMILIRKLAIKCLEENFRLFAKHVRSKDNQVADALSRMDFRRFRKLQRRLKLNTYPTALLSELWPINKVWSD